jgi:uncharacterized tellurite resistance protein B-like protein
MAVAPRARRLVDLLSAGHPRVAVAILLVSVTRVVGVTHESGKRRRRRLLGAPQHRTLG